MSTRRALDRHANGLTNTNHSRFALGHSSSQTKGMHLHQRDDRRARNHVLAGICRALPDHAADRRVEDRIGKLLPCDFELRSALRENALTISYFFERVFVLRF